MLADIVDEQELRSGQRQEGMVFSAIAFSGKATSALGTMIGGFALSAIGFPPNVDAAGVPPDVVFRMGVLMGPILGVCHVVPIVIYSFYRLDKKRLAEVHERLAALRTPGEPRPG